MTEVNISKEYVEELEKRNRELWEQVDKLKVSLSIAQSKEIAESIMRRRGMPSSSELLSDVLFLLGMVEKYNMYFGSRPVGMMKFLNIRAKYRKWMK